jgi:dynein heavy chain
VEEIDKEVQVFTKEIFTLHKKLNSKVSEQLKDRVQEFKHLLPNVLDLGNPSLRPRHFEKLFKLMKQQYYADMPFSLSTMLKGGVMQHKDAVAELSASASGEAQLGASLDKIKAGWEKMRFTVLNHR